MIGHHALRLVRQLERLTARLSDRHGLAEHPQRGGGPQADDHPGAYDAPLGVQPPATGRDMRGRGVLVDPPLAAQFMTEVLHRVGDIGPIAWNLRFRQGAVEHLAGRSDEGPPDQILLVAGLLAHQHQRRGGGPLARHALGGVAPELAAAAEVDPGGDLLQAGGRAFLEGSVARQALGLTHDPAVRL